MWLPIDDALHGLERAKLSYVLEKRVENLSNIVDSLNKRIAIKDSLIKVYESNEDINEKIIQTLRSEIKDYVEMRQELETTIGEYQKQIRKLKRKVKWAAILGTVTTVAAFVIPSLLKR